MAPTGSRQHHRVPVAIAAGLDDPKRRAVKVASELREHNVMMSHP
jgi:hypothetical protein